MLAFSRMKSVLAPCFSKATAFSFAVGSHSPPPISLFSKSIQLMNSSSFLHNPSIVSMLSTKALKNHSHSRQVSTLKPIASSSVSSSSSGEIHVIVGPMFAGKTTTLLKRIKSESCNGSFQATSTRKIDHINKTLKDLCLSGRVTEAVGILCNLNVQIEPETYSLLLQDCINRKDYGNGKRIHWQMIVFGFIPNEYISVKLLILYAKAGDLHTADILFDKLHIKSLVSWNAMIAGYVQKDLETVALIFFRKMRMHGIIPDQYTFSSVFKACASVAVLEQGKQAHALWIKTRVNDNLIVDSALMDMYFKCSSPSDGHLVFDKSLERNVVTWSALICGYGMHGRVLEVLGCFHRMIKEGFTPNHVTFLAVLSACSHGGLVNEGLEYFFSMERDYGIQPRKKHYAAVVDLLGRSGRLHDAYDFVRSSPCKDHPVLWGALLGACKMHGNMDIAKLAASIFFELETENAGKYVVLSNAFASLGMWSSVAKIRGVMKESGMRKEPGYSMIEVQREVHLFFMEHNTHEHTELIRELIKDMTCILKDVGPFPDLIT